MENINYLPFYLGCDCLLESEPNSKEPNIRKLRSVPFLFGELHAEFGDNTAYRSTEVKLMLRPLSDMNTTEWNEMAKWNRAKVFSCGDLWKLNAEETAWLLSKQFDLFGLIETGVAVDATKLKNVV